ncbi:MAG: 30S ribosomal protein S6 [Candidatus Cardinium sp.]|uniref:30S ribosomal protein S6 n=1 Tax=Cardinium endosymbiont of Dermatophagoides farinae TaxID=2597823 RepID=UPI00118287BA|nr:30S ribosomal protein S6 [Cardinium endosymbiont of Dermatophagoides farinae]TSJ81339.1 30S ribosomal protein S6 [Cardinium endosymbiont of Dermatophagoides farinae]UWW97402.1 MAG: 30S ribosomal protein S6 [Candidatus Cardinium sp.]
MRHYETVFILSPVLSNDQIKASIDKYRSFLVERNATITYEEELGLKPLAYQIKHKKSGVYHLIEFAGDPGLIKELEVTYARDEEVLRFLTFALDKHALAHNMERRSEQKESKKAAAV